MPCAKDCVTNASSGSCGVEKGHFRSAKRVRPCAGEGINEQFYYGVRYDVVVDEMLDFKQGGCMSLTSRYL